MSLSFIAGASASCTPYPRENPPPSSTIFPSAPRARLDPSMAFPSFNISFIMRSIILCCSSRALVTHVRTFATSEHRVLSQRSSPREITLSSRRWSSTASAITSKQRSRSTTDRSLRDDFSSRRRRRLAR